MTDLGPIGVKTVVRRIFWFSGMNWVPSTKKHASNGVYILPGSGVMEKERVTLWEEIADDFWDRILKEPEAGCWLWQGYLDGGYAKVRVGGKWHRVQRIVHEKFCGPIPEGAEVHHLCDNKRCVSPAHLLALSSQEHRKFHPENGPWSYCSRGHFLSEANTRLESDGKRKCRLCERLRDRAKRRTASAPPA